MNFNYSIQTIIQRNILWLLSLTILLVIYIFYVFPNESHEIFIRNNSQEKIEIKDIILNKKNIQSPIMLIPNQSDFIKAREILKHPNTNSLEIVIAHKNRETKLHCTFFIKKNNCQEEVVIESEKIWCEDFCSNVFD